MRIRIQHLLEIADPDLKFNDRYTVWKFLKITLLILLKSAVDFLLLIYIHFVDAFIEA